MGAYDNNLILPTKRSDCHEMAYTIMRDLGMDTESLGMVIDWMVECQILLHVPMQFETKTVVIPVEDCKAEKPCDYISIDRVMVEGNCVVPVFIPLDPALVNNGCQNFYGRGWNAAYYIRETEFRFDVSSNMNGENLVLMYNSYHFDDLGYPVIDRAFREAITAWVRWKYIIQQRNMGSPQYSGGDEQNAERQFRKWVRNNRGNKMGEKMNPVVAAQIAARWRNPYYVSTNPYIVGNTNANTAYGVGAGVLSNVQSSPIGTPAAIGAYGYYGGPLGWGW